MTDDLERYGDSTHEPLPEDGKEGLRCLECDSVIFEVGKLIRHLHERPGHRLFASGEDLVVSMDYLRDVDTGAVSHYQFLKDEQEDES
jgi:hypothetical protein